MTSTTPQNRPRLVPDEAHFGVLQDTPWEPYGAEGIMPVSWADLVLNRWNEFDPPLPQHRQNRSELRNYCQDTTTPPMHAYIAVMAWGLQLPQSRRYRESVQAKEDTIVSMVTRVRDGMGRADAYELWKGKVWGLGPSYFTKLLAFLSPDGSMAIMDQWASKSINLLYQSKVVKLDADALSQRNSGYDYARYCEHLEDLKLRLGEETLSATEERIFSREGPGTWREYLHQQLPNVSGRPAAY